MPLLYAKLIPLLANTVRASKSIVWAVCLCSVVGCSHQYKREPIDLLELPKTWQSHNGDLSAELSWTDIIQSDELSQLIAQALLENKTLAQKALDVEIARSSVFQGNMRYLPEFDVDFAARRQTSENAGTETSIANQISLSASFRYEANIWGQITDSKRAAVFSFAAAQADYATTRRSIIQQLASAWATVIESQQLLKLRQTRLDSLQKNLAIIEGGYRSGLNKALEVYLARNDVESERSRLIQSEQSLSDARRSLARLLGGYPENTHTSPDQFPTTALVLPPELPSEVLMRRPDIQAAWLRVLAQNSELAVAHKARFPSLTLIGSTGYQSSDLSDLLDDTLGWSLTASLLQPLLKSGSLKAAEDRQRLQLRQSELAYIDTVYQAFQEVESGLEKQSTLEQEHEAILRSRDNALLAEKLSFEQYQKGIVSYTTVLDAQRRALDAEIRLISLKKQIFVNKITLHEALAGKLDFDYRNEKLMNKSAEQDS